MRKKFVSRLLALIMIMTVVIPCNTVAASAATTAAFPTLSSSAYCEFVATKNMNVYKDSACKTRGTSSPALAYNALITTGDTCRILKITDTYINLKYPTSSGLRTGYIKRSTLIGVSAPLDKVTAQGKATTYKKAANDYYGFTEKDDPVYQLGASGNYTQIIYKAKSGDRLYKLGFVLKSDYISKICAPKISASSPYALSAGKTGTINLTFSGSGIDSVGGTVSGIGLSAKITSVTLGEAGKASISVTATSACTGGSIVFQLKNKTFGVIQSKTIKVNVTSTSPPAPPSTPSGVKAASASYSSIKVSWAKAANATGYEIYRATSSTGTYSKVGTVTSGSTLSYTNTSLVTGTKYYYKVRASRTVSGMTVYSSNSAAVNATPVLDKVTGAKAASASYNSIKVSWTKVSGASGYEIYRTTGIAGPYTKVGTMTSGSTVSYTNTGLTSGKVYYYIVRAYRTVSSTKAYGAYSAVVKDKPLPGKVGSVKAASAGSTSIKVSWGTVSGASGYEVYRATASGGTYAKAYTATSGSTSSYTNTGLTAGKAYYYKVRAYRTVSGVKVYGNFSSAVNAKPATPLTATLANKSTASYVNTKINAYVFGSGTTADRVRRNLSAGKSVVFFFEGAGANTSTKVRQGALCVVVKNVSGKPAIVFQDKYSTTIPDYPTDKTKNKDDYGVPKPMPTVIDGVYNILTTAHGNKNYPALSVSGAKVVRFDGTKAPVKSTSDYIHIHHRTSDTINNWNGVPNSAGCFLVGLTDGGNKAYNSFIKEVGSTDANKYKYLDKGIVIVDRSQATSYLLPLYNKNSTAVGWIQGK